MEPSRESDFEKILQLFEDNQNKDEDEIMNEEEYDEFTDI